MEDSKRHTSDNEVNNRRASVLLSNGETKQMAWQELQPGMIVEVKDREEIPTDLIPLVSSGEEGKCYIETANIDGETNLKLRNCAPCGPDGVPGWDTPEQLAKTSGIQLEFEPPNPSIHTFSGNVIGPNGKVPVGASEILLRGDPLYLFMRSLSLMSLMFLWCRCCAEEYQMDLWCGDLHRYRYEDRNELA